jgi:Flp pilus assembly protein CpaB
VVTAVALVPALVVGRLATGVEAERRRWGPGLPTVVAVDDIPSGAILTSAEVEVRRLPAGARPRDALAALPPGSVASAELAAGEAVVSSRLAPAGTSPVAARLPGGTRGIAVATDGGLHLRVGDHVDVLTTLDTDGSQPTVTVARGALVVDLADKAVTVAVDADEQERVAFALAAGVVTLSLTGSASP